MQKKRDRARDLDGSSMFEADETPKMSTPLRRRTHSNVAAPHQVLYRDGTTALVAKGRYDTEAQ